MQGKEIFSTRPPNDLRQIDVDDSAQPDLRGSYPEVERNQITLFIGQSGNQKYGTPAQPPVATNS